MAMRVMLAVLAGWGAAQATLWAFGLSEVTQALALDAQAVTAGEYWRLISSQLFHVSFLHFAVNAFILFLAGRDVEPIFGRRPFIALCLVTGLLGSLVNCAAAPHTAALGFSAPIAAILVAYTTILPELEHRVWLWFPLPRGLRAKHFSVGVVLFAAGCLATGSMLAIGPAGILVGSVLGWAWARHLGFANPFWFQRRRIERRQLELRRQRMSADDFMAEEIDPILDKIACHGMASLTRTERQLLEEGRGKLVRKSAGKEYR
jgi:membrane associated rhomboid family serine protease